jgi:hypothetical protein
MRHATIAAVLSLVLARGTAALWTFNDGMQPKAEALVDVGPLGLGNVTGRIAALGDWNGDQKSVRPDMIYTHADNCQARSFRAIREWKDRPDISLEYQQV